MAILPVIPEGTTSYLSVTFKNKSGVATAPSSATWQAIDLDTGTSMKSSTAITPIADTVEVTIPPSVNAIHDESRKMETRRIIVIGVYGADDAVVGTFDYNLRNVEVV